MRRPCSSIVQRKVSHPTRWGLIEDETPHLHFWEFRSPDIDGLQVDTSQRNSVSRQPTMPQDAWTIANFTNTAFVVDGWISLTRG